MNSLRMTETSPPFAIPSEFAEFRPSWLRVLNSLFPDTRIQKFDSPDDSSRSVVVKKYGAPFKTAARSQIILREISLLSSLKHDNILRMLTVYKAVEGTDNVETVYHITEYCGEPLSEKIEKGEYSMQSVKKWMRESLKALQYLHANRVIHREVHPGKICINSNNKATLIGFGIAHERQSLWQEHSLSECFNQKHSVVIEKHDISDISTVRQNYHYFAFEQLINLRDCDEKVDIWSIGAILCELLIGRPLFGSDNVGITLKMQINYCGPIEECVLKKVESNVDRKAIAEYSMMSHRQEFPHIQHEAMLPGRGITQEDINGIPELRDFIDKTLHLNAQKRLSAEEALAHPFLKTLQPWETQLPEDEGEALQMLRQQIFETINYH